jgi:MscS family membrane protein
MNLAQDMANFFRDPQNQYIGAGTIIIVGLFLAFIIRDLFKGALRGITQKTKTELDDAFLKNTQMPIFWLVVLSGLYLGLSMIKLPDKPYDFPGLFSKTMQTLIAVDITWFVLRLVNLLEAYLRQLHKKTGSRLDDKLLPIIRKILKVFVIAIAGLLIIQNLGYSVTGLWAGLGIGGIAIALASRDTVANIFGSIVIFADRLFQVGDHISAGGAEGVIEDIGFRSTRLRTPDRSMVIMPNSTLAQSKVENYSLRLRRPVKFCIPLPLDFSEQDAAGLEKKIYETLQQKSEVIKDSGNVYVSDISTTGSTLQIEYALNTLKDKEFQEAREKVNFAILNILKEAGLAK